RRSLRHVKRSATGREAAASCGLPFAVAGWGKEQATGTPPRAVKAPMPHGSPKSRRIFSGGWLSDADASIMALLWQVRSGSDEDTPPQFEAEVIRGVEKIASLRASSVEE